MTQRDFFGQNFYEGVMKGYATAIIKGADMPNSLSMADETALKQHWKNLTKAMRLWEGIVEAGENIFIGKKGHSYLFEYKDDSVSTDDFFYLKAEEAPTGDVKYACVKAHFADDGNYSVEPVKCTEKEIAPLIIMAYIPFLQKDDEKFDIHFTAIKPYLLKEFINESDWDADSISNYTNYIGYLKYRFSNTIPFKEIDGNLRKLSAKEFDSIQTVEWNAIVGIPLKVQTVKSKSKGNDMSLDYVFDENKYLIPKPELYITPERTRTPEELAKIPMISRISVSPLAKKYYNAIMKTFSVPFRNFYFLGGAGIGKSTLCRVLAFMLGLPYSDTTCYAEMEMTDILGGVFPINGDEEKENSERTYEQIYEELGVSLDMLRDKDSFSIAYETLTGEFKESVTEEEVFSTFIRKVSEKISTKSSSEGIIYKYVPSDLVKSISADGIGGVHEIKEPTVIRNEGVLVGLNSLLAEGTLTLPNGEMVKRNPNSIIIMTSNSDYAGCQELNESVISRMHMVENMDFLSVEEMVARAKDIFGNSLEDNYYVAMAESIKNIEHWIESDDERMGISSFREYQNWIELTLKTVMSDCPTREELLATAEATVKFKASQRKEDLTDDFELEFKPLDMF